MPDVVDFCWKCVWAIVDVGRMGSLPVIKEVYLPMKDVWVNEGPGPNGRLNLHDIEAFYCGHVRWRIGGFSTEPETLPMIAITTVDNSRVCSMHISRRMGQ